MSSTTDDEAGASQEELSAVQLKHSLKPILTSLKIIMGIRPDLADHHDLVSISRSLVFTVAIIAGAFVFSNSITTSTSTVDFPEILSHQSVIIHVLQGIVNKSSAIQFISLFHLFSMIILWLSRRWKEIWLRLSRIQNEMRLNGVSFHHQSRKKAFFSLFLMASDGAAFLFIYWMTQMPNNSLTIYASISALLNSTLVIVPAIIEAGIQASFYMFVSIAWLLLSELNQRLEKLTKKARNNIDISTNLDNWRQHHDLVCRLVDEINRHFGPVLLVILFHTCIVSFLCLTVCLDVIQQRNDNTLSSLVLFAITKMFLRWLIILEGSRRITIQANKLKETVRLFRQPRERQGTFHFNIQLSNVMLQVSLDRPKISAMDFVDLDASMLQTVILMMIFYVRIVHQVEVVYNNRMSNSTQGIVLKNMSDELLILGHTISGF